MDKEQEAIDFIKEHCNGMPYTFYFSGGKDSVIVRHLLQRAGVEYNGMYKVSTLEPEGMIEFIERHEDITIIHPEKDWSELVRDSKILPTKDNRYCCREIRNKWDDDPERIKISGITNETWRHVPSNVRMINDKKYMIYPILDWTLEERSAYVEKYGLESMSKTERGPMHNCAFCPVMKYSSENFADHYSFVEEVGKREFPEIYERFKAAAYESFETLKREGYAVLAETPEDYFRDWMNGEPLLGGVRAE